MDGSSKVHVLFRRMRWHESSSDPDFVAGLSFLGHD